MADDNLKQDTEMAQISDRKQMMGEPDLRTQQMQMQGM